MIKRRREEKALLAERLRTQDETVTHLLKEAEKDRASLEQQEMVAHYRSIMEKRRHMGGDVVSIAAVAKRYQASWLRLGRVVVVVVIVHDSPSKPLCRRCVSCCDHNNNSKPQRVVLSFSLYLSHRHLHTAHHAQTPPRTDTANNNINTHHAHKLKPNPNQNQAAEKSANQHVRMSAEARAAYYKASGKTYVTVKQKCMEELEALEKERQQVVQVSQRSRCGG